MKSTFQSFCTKKLVSPYIPSFYLPLDSHCIQITTGLESPHQQVWGVQHRQMSANTALI